MNHLRRIKVLFLVGVLFCQQSVAQLAAISGAVLDAELKKGISGVAVTDGYTIVLTDKKGNYKLTPHANAKFVYITIPSGYQIPVDKNLPQYYSTLHQSK